MSLPFYILQLVKSLPFHIPEPSLSIRPSYGARGEEILDGTSLPFSLPFFPFSPETPDTQANLNPEKVLLSGGASPYRTL